MSTCSKPVLKGLHNATIKRNLIGMCLTVMCGATTLYLTVNKPRKQRFADFYKNYDAEKAFERMRDAGLLQSTPPLPPDPKTKKK